MVGATRCLSDLDVVDVSRTGVASHIGCLRIIVGKSGLRFGVARLLMETLTSM